MLLVDALNCTIDDGIEAARHDYATPRHLLKRESAIDGFEACRNKSPAEIAALLVEANQPATRPRGRMIHGTDIGAVVPWKSGGWRTCSQASSTPRAWRRSVS